VLQGYHPLFKMIDHEPRDEESIGPHHYAVGPRTQQPVIIALEIIFVGVS
jgi:hypothetical protein